MPEGTTVYYCYTVTNTGDVAFGLHTLTDDVLGTIFTGLAYTLAPGASVNTVAGRLVDPVRGQHDHDQRRHLAGL